MATQTALQFDQPMAEMNTTPLIDVLLVLLIMFIMSVPIAANVIPVDLPQPDQKATPVPIRPENLLSLDPTGTIRWNGQAVSEIQLATTLGALRHLEPEPLVKFQPQPLAPYGNSARVIDIVKNSGVGLFAITGNEAYSEFGKQPGQ